MKTSIAKGHWLSAITTAVFLTLVSACGGGDSPVVVGSDPTNPDGGGSGDSGDNNGGGDNSGGGDNTDNTGGDGAGDGGGGNSDGGDNTGDDEQIAPAVNPYAISGEISVVDGVALDSDTNDPNQTMRMSNNTLDTSQVINVNPVSISGYLNMPGEGPVGATSTEGDRLDSYYLRLEKDQVIELDFIAPANVADVDLLVFDENQALVGNSDGQSSYECVRVAQSGTYHVVAGLYTGSQGGTIYQIRIGAPGANSSNCPNVSNLQSLVIPGELIVQENETDQRLLKSNARPFHAQVVKGQMAPKYRALIQVPENLTVFSGTSAIQAKSVNQSQWIPGSKKPHSTEQLERTLLAAKMMRNSPQFKYASLNYRVQAFQNIQLVGEYPPNDRIYYAQAWHYNAIDLPAAMATISQLPTQPSRRPVVAVVDSGIVSNHPDLQNMLVPGIDTISDPTNSLDGDGVDQDPTDDTVEGLGGSGFHGTHVAGTIAAQTFNGVYGAGVAPMAQIMPVRALGVKGGTTMDIAEGIAWAAGLPNSTGVAPPAQTADVFNLSLGGPGPCTSAEQSLFEDLRERGIITAVASGNSSEENRLISVSSPANCPNVIAVGATDASNDRAPYSNGGPSLDLVAPGGDVSQRKAGTGFPDGIASTIGVFSSGQVIPEMGLKQGTSMAAPHAAGVFALMKYIMPGITQDDVQALILAGSMTTDLGSPGEDNQFGHGLISASMAVQEALRLAGDPGTQPPGRIQVQPVALALGSIRSEAEFEVSAVGSTDDTVSSIVSDSIALVVNERDVDPATGLGTYTVGVDRSQIPSGESLFAEIVVSLNSGDAITLNVTAQRSNASSGTVGPVYVLVIDSQASTAEEFVVPAQARTLEPLDGKYFYQVDIPGTPRISVFAGTDMDNDGLICDLGEACGAYPLLGSQTEVIEANGANLSGVDFTVETQTGLEGSSALNALTPVNPGGERGRGEHGIARRIQ
jgi:serine protease